MSAKKLTQRALLAAAIALQDLMHIVDVSDTSKSPQGSSYKMTAQQLSNFMKLAGMGNWKSVAPTVNDDSTQGYVNGAFWFDEDAQRLYILNDNSAGAADWVLFDMTFIYNSGNLINGNQFKVDKNELALCEDAEANAFNNYCIGQSAGNGANMSGMVAIGTDAGKNATGADGFFIGDDAGDGNTGSNVIGIGRSAAANNTAGDFVSIGQVAGNGKSNAFAISANLIPSYADHTAALAALTVANGCVAAQVYIYRNVATDAIGFVIPA
jgi:hypothetical protein